MQGPVPKTAGDKAEKIKYIGVFMKKSKSAAAVAEVAQAYSENTEKRIKELKRLVSEGRKTGDILMVGAAYCLLSEAYDEKDDLHGTLVSALKAVTILENTDEYELLAKSYFALGRAYINQGAFQMSLVCDEQAYGIVKKHRIKGETKIAALNNLSVSYHAMDEPRKSIKHLNECIDLLKKDYAEKTADLFMYSINLAGCYKDVGEFERAEEIFDSINSLAEKVDFKPLVCDYYIRRAIVSYLRKDRDSGNGYMDSALSIFPKDVYPIPLYDDLCEVSRIITKSKDRKRSERIFDIMTVYAKNNPGTLEQLFAVRMMSNYYKDFGEYKLAAEYFAKYEELNDKQLREVKETELKLHETTRRTEAEIGRLQRKMRENELLFSIEPLTKLLNRSALLRVSEKFIESAAKKRQKVGAVFFDIDYFKQCNDTYGHARGDEIIKEVARICRNQETKNVRFARYGGDEFFAITKGLADEEVCNVARKVCRAVLNAGIANERNPNGGIVTLSVGVVNVAITDRTDTILEIANYADKALYHAKNSGRNAIYEIVYRGDETEDAGASYVRIDF